MRNKCTILVEQPFGYFYQFLVKFSNIIRDRFYKWYKKNLKVNVEVKVEVVPLGVIHFCTILVHSY